MVGGGGKQLLRSSLLSDGGGRTRTTNCIRIDVPEGHIIVYKNYGVGFFPIKIHGEG